MSLVAFSAASRAFKLPKPPDHAVELGAQPRVHWPCFSRASISESAWVGPCISLLVRVCDRASSTCGRILTARERLERLLELVAARRVGLLAQRADQRHAFAQPHPMHELADLAVDDRFGLLERRAARVEIGADDARQVVERVEEHVVELARFLLDVARHREVDHEHRPAAARAQRALDQALAEDRQRGCGA